MADAAPTNDLEEVILIDPDGKPARVPSANASSALGDGFRRPTEDELRAEVRNDVYGDVAGKLGSFLTGAARGATLGLSDIALTKTGVVDREAAQSLKEANPITSVVGEGVGFLAGGAVGGTPAGLLGKAGAAAEGLAAKGLGGLASRGLAGRILAKGAEKAVGGALEGAIVGGAQAFDESVLGDTDLTADKVIASVGWGALIGGGAGGVLGGGIELGGAIAKKAAQKAAKSLGDGGVKKWLEDFAGERTLKGTLGQQKRAFDQLESKGRKDEAMDYLRTKVLPEVTENTTEAMAEKLAQKQAELGGQLESLVQIADEATANDQLKRLSPLQVASRIEQDVATPLKALAAERDTYNAVMKEVEAIRELGNSGMAFSDAVKQRQAIQGKVNYDVINGLKSSADAKNQIARIWNDVIDEHVEPVLGGLGYPEAQGAYRALRKEYSLVTDLEKYAANRVRGNEANRILSPSDYGVGAVMGLADASTGGAASMAGGVLSSIGHKIVRERGNLFVAKLADKASRLRIVQKLAQDTDKQIVQAVDRFVTRIGKAPTALAPVTTRAMMDVPVTAPLRRVADQEEGRKVAFKKRVRELSELAAAPASLADRLASSTRHMADVAPNLSGVLGAKVSRNAQWLLEKAPKNPTTPTMFDTGEDWSPSDTEIEQWGRYYEAVEDPLSVLRDLEHGSVSPEGVEALRELHPKLYEDVRKQVFERVTAMEKAPPYRDRIALGVLFDVPLDVTMQPDFTAALKHQFQQQQQQQSPQQGGGGSGAPMRLAEAMKTSSQRLLER